MTGLPVVLHASCAARRSPNGSGVTNQGEFVGPREGGREAAGRLLSPRRPPQRGRNGPRVARGPAWHYHAAVAGA